MIRTWQHAAVLCAFLVAAPCAKAGVAVGPEGDLLITPTPGGVWTPADSEVPGRQLLNPFGDARGDGPPSTGVNPATGAVEVAWGRAGAEPSVMFATWDADLAAWTVRTLARAAGTSRWAGRVVQLLHDTHGNRYVVFEDFDTGRVLLASAPRDSLHVNRPLVISPEGMLATSPHAAWDGEAVVVAFASRRDGAGIEVVRLVPDWDAEGRIPNGGEGVPGIPELAFAHERSTAPVLRPVGAGILVLSGLGTAEPPLPLVRTEVLTDGRVLVTWIDGDRLSYTVREGGQWSAVDWQPLDDALAHGRVRAAVRELLSGRIVVTPSQPTVHGARAPDFTIRHR